MRRAAIPLRNACFKQCLRSARDTGDPGHLPHSKFKIKARARDRSQHSRCGFRHFVSVDRKARERIRAERGSDGDIGRVAATRHQHAADARNVVARIEGVPAIAQIDLEPGGEIHRPVRPAARRYRRDSRCNSAPEYSCSGTTRSPGARSRGTRPGLLVTPARRSWSGAHAHSRIRCARARNRRSPAPAASRGQCPNIAQAMSMKRSVSQ